MNAFGVGVNGDGSKNGNQKRDWRAICEQIVREETPERFEQLLADLLKALDERSARDIASRKP
jgi:hypothetical protein